MILLVLVGSLVLVAYLRRQRRPSPFGVIVGLAIALLASWVVLSLRYGDTRDGLTSTLSRLSPTRVVAPVVKGADAEMAPALAGALTAVPDELPYRLGGATIGDLLTRPIRRRLWDGKPETPAHRVVAVVWPEARERGKFDPALTPLFFFFWDFSLPGVIVGMAVYGGAARALYDFLHRWRSRVVAQLLFAMGLTFLVVAVRFDPVLVIVHSIVLFAPVIAIFGFAKRPAAVAPQSEQSQEGERHARRLDGTLRRE